MNITRSSASISRATSRWIAAAVFFLRCPAPGLLLQGSQAADLFVDGDELGTELQKAVEFGNLSLRFAECRRAGKGLRYGLAMHLAQNTNLRFVPRIFGLGTMAVGLTATMNNGRDGTGAQITQT